LQNLDYEMCGLADADLVIAVGYDMVEFAPRLWNKDGSKKIIHIDTLPAEVDEHYLPTVEIVSEIGEALRALMTACRTRKPPVDEGRLKSTVLSELNAYVEDDAVPMKPQRILGDMRRVLSDRDVVISDVGAHKLWIARLYPAEQPNTVIISNGFATMGIAVPGGIAAKLAQPDRRVVAVTGDGGFLMNVQELETAKRLGTPFAIVVWVDSGFGSIPGSRRPASGAPSASNLVTPTSSSSRSRLACLASSSITPTSLLRPFNAPSTSTAPRSSPCPWTTRRTAASQRRSAKCRWRYSQPSA
jgi:acetolactate synthase-1/2/3 large subunit